MKLERDFFLRPTLDVARDLVGKRLVHVSPEGTTAGRVVEVEAYVGEDDPANHAAAGRTSRTDPMYGPGGFAYVYFVYGMHHCFNAVTEPAGKPCAVLIRALEAEKGLDLMERRRWGAKGTRRVELCNGPAKLCQAMGIGRSLNQCDLTGDVLFFEDDGYQPGSLIWAPRVGVVAGRDRPWRAYLEGSPSVSRR